MFSLHHNSKGDIIAYQQHPEDEDDATPEGCETLTYDEVPPIFSSDGRLTHKVDMLSGDLVPLKVMPKPMKQAQGTLSIAEG